MVKSLALKVLEVSLFLEILLQSVNFDTCVVYHVVGNMMRDIVQMPTNVAMKESKESPIIFDEEGIDED